jgi:hypothetical protein
MNFQVLEKRLRRIKRTKRRKGIFTREEFVEMVKVVDQGMRRRSRANK